MSEVSSPDRDKTYVYSKEMFKYVLDVSQNFFFGGFLETQEPSLYLHTVVDVVEGEHASYPARQVWQGLHSTGNAICTGF